jgi:hypothetical protein
VFVSILLSDGSEAREVRLAYEKKAWGIQPQREYLHA